MLRFYRYVIYRLYIWRLKKNDKTPVTTVELILSLVHIFQLFTLYIVLVSFFPSIHRRLHIVDWQVLCFAFAFHFLYHLVIYNEKRWTQYCEEFKNEPENLRKKGTYLVNLFLVGSILLFFICLPLFLSNKH